MRPCWKMLGLTEAGAKIADATIDELVHALEHIPHSLHPSLLTEAHYRVFVLPLLTKAYRRNYEKLNYNSEVSHGRGRGKRASGKGSGRGGRQGKSRGSRR